MALLLATVWALGTSLAVPCPKSLRLYFAANLAYELGTQPFLYWFGETSLAYAIAYYIGAALHFAAALNVMRAALSRGWHFALGATVACAVAWRAYIGMAAPIHHYQYFGLLEGFALSLAGTALIFSAARNQQAGILIVLSSLWLALAWFRLCFYIAPQSELWDKLNDSLPTWLVCSAFGWIGLRLLEQRKTYQDA